MYCPQCSGQISGSEAFCPYCAAPLAAPIAAAGSAPGSFAKAPPFARLLAVFIDSIVAGALLAPGIILQVSAARTGEASVAGLILLALGGLWELAYLLGRDGFGGAGIGKRLTGLTVISTRTGGPAGVGASAIRQFVLYATNLVPLLGSLIEPYFVLTEAHGLRLGDKAAHTQVVSTAELTARMGRPARGKGAAIGAFAAFLAVSMLGSAIAGFVAWRGFADAGDAVADSGYTATAPADPTAGAGEGAAADPSGQDGATDPGNPAAGGDGTGQAAVAPGAGTPEEAIDAFYAALAAGDDAALDAALSSAGRSGTDVSTFAGWVTPSYQVLGSEQLATGGFTVQVQEFDGGLANGIVSFSLVQEDGWRVSDWVLGDDAAASEPGAETPPDMTPYGLSPEAAESAVMALLDAMIADKMDDARWQTTSNFEETEPGFFTPTAGAFTGYEITEVFPDGGTYVVGVTEMWISGPEDVRYVVITEDNEPRVDVMLLDYE